MMMAFQRAQTWTSFDSWTSNLKVPKIDLKASIPLSPQRTTIFRRLVRFYPNFLLLSALTGGLSVGTLQFSEFHPCTTALDTVASGFLTSSASSAVLAVMLAVMLNFHFENTDTMAEVTRLDYGVAWTPLVLLDWSILAVLAGLMCWYWETSKGWRAGVMIGSVSAVLCFAMWVAWWMWHNIHRREEKEMADYQGWNYRNGGRTRMDGMAQTV